MSNVKLTDHQYKFCEYFSIHRNAADAFRFAGYSCKGLDLQRVNSEAAKVIKNPNVQLRLHELATDSRLAFKITVAQKKHWLNTMIRISMQTRFCPKTGNELFTGDVAIAKGAINELNKMDGDHSPTKAQVTGQINIVIDSDDDDL